MLSIVSLSRQKKWELTVSPVCNEGYGLKTSERATNCYIRWPLSSCGRSRSCLEFVSIVTPDELKTWREKHNLLQAELAEMLGVFWLTISKWENGVQKIPPYLHLALAELARRIKAKKSQS